MVRKRNAASRKAPSTRLSVADFDGATRRGTKGGQLPFLRQHKKLAATKQSSTRMVWPSGSIGLPARENRRLGAGATNRGRERTVRELQGCVATKAHLPGKNRRDARGAKRWALRNLRDGVRCGLRVRWCCPREKIAGWEPFDYSPFLRQDKPALHSAAAPTAQRRKPARRPSASFRINRRYIARRRRPRGRATVSG
jgi:hypothetical protein